MSDRAVKRIQTNLALMVEDARRGNGMVRLFLPLPDAEALLAFFAAGLPVVEGDNHP